MQALSAHNRLVNVAAHRKCFCFRLAVPPPNGILLCFAVIKLKKDQLGAQWYFWKSLCLSMTQWHIFDCPHSAHEISMKILKMFSLTPHTKHQLYISDDRKALMSQAKHLRFCLLCKVVQSDE